MSLLGMIFLLERTERADLLSTPLGIITLMISLFGIAIGIMQLKDGKRFLPWVIWCLLTAAAGLYLLAVSRDVGLKALSFSLAGALLALTGVTHLVIQLLERYGQSVSSLSKVVVIILALLFTGVPCYYAIPHGAASSPNPTAKRLHAARRLMEETRYLEAIEELNAILTGDNRHVEANALLVLAYVRLPIPDCAKALRHFLVLPDDEKTEIGPAYAPCQERH